MLIKRIVAKIFYIFSDILTLSLSLYLAYLLRFEGNIPLSYLKNYTQLLIIFLIIKTSCFYFLGLYNLTLRYVGLPEIISVGKANIYSFFILGSCIFIFRGMEYFSYFPRSILFIDLLISFLFISGLRLSRRIKSNITGPLHLSGDKVLIVGAGDAGQQLLRNILEVKNSGYLPVGFIDDDPLKQGMKIHGVEILGNRQELPKIAKEFKIDSLLIAIPSVSSKVIKETVEFARNAGITKVRILPSLAELISGKVGVKDIKDIDLTDLLGRQQIKLETKPIESYIKGNIVLVTGAAGSIGSELCRQVAKFSPAKLIILDQDETGIFNLNFRLRENFPHLGITYIVGNIRDETKMETVFSEFKPSIVFHAAAYKHVPLMEEFPEEAVKTNILGSFILARLAVKYEAEKFVLISTDKAADPSSVMGATKRVAEMIMNQFNRAEKTKFVAVRFGNVLESRGNMFQIFKEEIKDKRAVTITDPQMKRYLITISEAVLLVLQAAQLPEGEIFVLDMGKLVSVIDFAKELIRLSGYEPDKDIPIVFTSKRPGEKVVEEYLGLKEKTIPTKYNKILAIESGVSLAPDFNDALDKLINASNKDIARAELIGILKEIVPNNKIL